MSQSKFKKTEKKQSPFSMDFFLKLFLIVVIFLGLIKLLLVYGSEQGEKKSETDHKSDPITIEDFAKCLSEKGMVMYGVDTCEYCQTQKKMFGSAFSKVNYINCEFEQSTCAKENIFTYPVWTYQGKQFAGILFFPDLSKITSCHTPFEY